MGGMFTLAATLEFPAGDEIHEAISKFKDEIGDDSFEDFLITESDRMITLDMYVYLECSYSYMTHVGDSVKDLAKLALKVTEVEEYCDGQQGSYLVGPDDQLLEAESQQALEQIICNIDKLMPEHMKELKEYIDGKQLCTNGS